MSIGIGQPRKIPTQEPGVKYWFLKTSINTYRGTKTTSPMAMSYQAVSNDCNDVLQKASTNCIGLNTARVFPGPGADNGFGFNRSRGYLAPGCVTFESGQTNPTYTKTCQPE